MGRVIDAGDRLLVVPGPSDQDIAAEVDRLAVERELASRGLVPLEEPARAEAEAVSILHLNRVPALEVRRVVPPGCPVSLEARVFDRGGDRAVPFEPAQPVRATNNPTPPDRTGDLWTYPWVEPLLDLRRRKVLTPGALTWALVRGRDDKEWGLALLAVEALAADGESIDPIVAFVRRPMEAAGYCFFCGIRGALGAAECPARESYLDDYGHRAADLPA